jgi:hypothetical protein
MPGLMQVKRRKPHAYTLQTIGRRTETTMDSARAAEAMGSAAALFTFPCSDTAARVTGAGIAINGGMPIH